MQGPIAQIIALTAWGNSALGGATPLDEASFYPANSTFLFCEYVQFVDLRRSGTKWEEEVYASDPVAWFKRIKQEGAYTLRMNYGPSDSKKLEDNKTTDRMQVGFIGGGGRWVIEAVTPTGSDYWEARWEVGDSERQDQKVWRVTYCRIAANASSLSPEVGVNAAEIREKLTVNLSKIAEFARAHHEEGFARAFDSGLARLTSPRPLDGLYHTDLAPQDILPESSAQLLGAAQAAWVFGAMGSWNDMSFDGKDQLQYDELSEELYLLLNAAIVTAANSSSSNSPAKPQKAWWQLWK